MSSSDKIALVALFISLCNRPIELLWNVFFKSVSKKKSLLLEIWNLLAHYLIPIIIIIMYWVFGFFDKYFVLNVSFAFSVLSYNVCLSTIYPIINKIITALELINKNTKNKDL